MTWNWYFWFSDAQQVITLDVCCEVLEHNTSDWIIFSCGIISSWVTLLLNFLKFLLIWSQWVRHAVLYVFYRKLTPVPQGGAQGGHGSWVSTVVRSSWSFLIWFLWGWINSASWDGLNLLFRVTFMLAFYNCNQVILPVKFCTCTVICCNLGFWSIHGRSGYMITYNAGLLLIAHLCYSCLYLMWNLSQSQQASRRQNRRRIQFGNCVDSALVLTWQVLAWMLCL